MSAPALTRALGLCRHNIKLWIGEIEVPVILVGMPLLMMAFLQPVYQDMLAAQGVPGATGAEQAVPGMAVMFSVFGAAILGADLHRERLWFTWDRLRASGATTPEIIFGKVVPPLVVLASQLTLLFGAGMLLFGLRVRGSALGLVIVAAALALAMLALGLAMASLFRSITALSAAGNALGIALAGLGGAITPASSLPGWASAIAPTVPTHWAMRGFHAAILPDGGLAQAARPALVLLGFALGFAALAAYRFRRAGA